MIKMGAKRSRATKLLSPVSCDPDNTSSLIIASAVKVASSEDLLIQILLHVPIKTLLNFKSVSKQWFCLITSPRFVHLYKTCSTSTSSLFFVSSLCSSYPDYQFIPLEVTDVSRPPFKTLDFIRDPLGSGISVLQSCNGLLLCASYRAREFNRRYYVYNPTTKQFATLPQIRREYAKEVCGMSLAFDPIKSPCYKVVCVRRFGKSRQLFQIEIYSSETPLWRVSGQPFAAPTRTQFEYGTYWNGSLHWWNRFIYKGGVPPDERYTLYFKIDEERVEQLPLPTRDIVTVQRNGRGMVNTYYAVSYIGESEGHWHLVEQLRVPSNYSDFTGVFNVYEMARDYSGWFVKYQVDLNAICNAFPEIIKYSYNRCIGYKLNILSLVRSGKEEEAEDGPFLVVEIPGGKVVRYNLVDKSVTKLWEFTPIGYKFYNDDGLRRDYVFALPYIESLACV